MSTSGSDGNLPPQPDHPRPDEVITVEASDGLTGETKNISYTNCRACGNGSFGVVYKANLMESDEVIAIKRVLQDSRFRNRELQIMRSVRHPNVMELKYFFYTRTPRDETYLNLVLEFIPETVFQVSRFYYRNRQPMPPLYVKLYTYQLLRALAYIHVAGICHRDIKPQNLLVNPNTGVLKLCDFGSAKVLVPGEPNVAYICSRYYRAPELIFGATGYTCSIDVWSTGCVMAELILGQPLFPGESGIDQLVEIIKVLGTPSRQQIEAMNPAYVDHRFPTIRPHPFSRVFRNRASQDAIDFIPSLLDYTPTSRLTAVEAMAHTYFDDLRDPNATYTETQPLPELFNFSQQELMVQPEVNHRLVPERIIVQMAQVGLDMGRFFPNWTPRA